MASNPFAAEALSGGGLYGGSHSNPCTAVSGSSVFGNTGDGRTGITSTSTPFAFGSSSGDAPAGLATRLAADGLGPFGSTTGAGSTALDLFSVGGFPGASGGAGDGDDALLGRAGPSLWLHVRSVVACLEVFSTDLQLRSAA